MKYIERKSSMLNEDCTIKIYSDDIFKDIAAELEMSQKAVHLAVLRSADKIFGEGNYVTPCTEKTITGDAQEEDIDY